jgi:Tol biopolymer transport system component/DNA-binding winged helix-turn-helix (wHTH) protein
MRFSEISLMRDEAGRGLETVFCEDDGDGLFDCGGVATYNCAPMPEMNQRESTGLLRFGEYELDPRRGVLSHGGLPLKIQPQPLRALELLVTRAPRVVTREELSDYVWGNGVNVDLDQSLNFCVRQIRSVLNDSASNPRFIDTLPKQGYRFIGDVVREAEPVTVAGSVSRVSEPPCGAVSEVSGRVSRRTFVWSGAAAAAAIGGGVWLATSRPRKGPPSAISIIPLPEGATNADSTRLIGPAAVAPDGSAIAVSLTTAEVTHLYLRRLDSNRLIRLEGTAHSSIPFWSPDSQHLGYFSEGKLKRLPAVGGSAMVLCDAPDARGGSWGRGGKIIFGSGFQPIFEVDEAGGPATRVTQLDQTAGENSHWMPIFLPDGKRFLYFARTDDPDRRGIYLESLDPRQARRRVLVADGSFTLARDPERKVYYLLSQQSGKIAAQVFDMDRGELSGPSRMLLDRTGMISVSDNGVLVIRAFGQEMSRLVWLDRAGREVGTLGAPGDYEGVHLSPNDRFAVMTKADSLSGQSRVWIATLRDGTLEPLSDSNRVTNPTWSDDSGTVYYNDERRGALLRRAVSPRGAEEVAMEMGAGRRVHVEGISPDGRYAVAELIADSAHVDVAWTELKGTPEWHSVGAVGGSGRMPGFSPDGRWLAFSSSETGGPEIYVIDFPGGSQRVRVSNGGGLRARWRRDGKELFYLSTDGNMMAAKISVAGGLLTTESQRLFGVNLKLHTNSDANYAVSSDGQKFLGIAREVPSGDVDIQMVLNWQSLLRE